MTRVAGIELSHPDRVLYPEQGLTKLDLARYYEAVAPWMLPHVAGRPLTLVRCPEGRRKACFYQKHWGGRTPSPVHTVAIREGKGTVQPYPVISDAAGLVALVQHGVLEFHLWGARADRVEAPDRIVFDLDPAPDVSWTRVREGARLLRGVVASLGLESWVKSTGGKGLHLVIPIARRSSWAEVAAFARALAYRVAREHPERYLATAGKRDRGGRIFIDWLRNTRGATAIAPWSTRAREGAPVAVPLAWGELGRVRGAGRYDPGRALALARQRSVDPWGGLPAARQRLTPGMTTALGGGSGGRRLSSQQGENLTGDVA